MQIEQLQKIIFDYFKDIDDATIVEIVNAFVYDVPNPKLGAGKLIEKFLEDNGLVDAHINYLYDKTDGASLFRRSSLSQSSMIENVKMSLLGLSFNRLSSNVGYDSKIEAIEEKIQKREEKIQKIKSTANKKSFNLVKHELLRCYSSFNNNEQYFYSEKEDAKFVADIKKIELL